MNDEAPTIREVGKLLALIDRNGPEVVEGSRCWLYTGTADKRGRGQIWLDGHNWNVRRALYVVFTGELPDVELRRACGTKNCVRPEHQVLTQFTRGFWNRKPPVERHGKAIFA